MDSILVRGNGALSGAIPIAGAKNACLTLMPATLLSDEPLTLTNAPRLRDIRTMTQLLQSLGAEVASLQDGLVLALSSRIRSPTSRPTTTSSARCAPRSWSLARCWPAMVQATVSLPGGCAIGARPVDLHLKALEAMGADLDLRDGYVHAKAPGGRLKGAVVDFPFVSVGATENALMAATLAKGTTVLKNAAREPEIVDLARCLKKMGAKIDGEGTSTITIEGTDRLGGATHQVVTDRIELGTYMLVPAICGGEVECIGGTLELVRGLRRKAGCGGGLRHADQPGPEGLPQERPGAGGGRHDRTLPRLPDRPAGADDGASLHGGRDIRPGREDLREPLHARPGTDPDGREDRRPWRHGDRDRRRKAEGRAGDGDRSARLGVA